MIRPAALLAFLLLSPLSIESSAIHIRANEAHSEKEALVLSGQVVIERTDFRVTAKQARVLPDKNAIDTMDLAGDVRISLPGGAALQCDRANFYPREHRAVFRSDASPQSEPTVTFTQEGIQVRSRRLMVILDTTGKEIRELEALDDVTIDYNGQYVAHTDRAHFQPTAGIPNTGLLRLEPGRKGICHIATKDGDTIDADGIDIDNDQGELSFKNPDGDFMLIQDNGLVERVHFSSDQLYWNQRQQELALLGNVDLQHRGMGDLQASESIHVKLARGRRSFESVRAQGRTVLTYLDDTTQEVHKITCFGTVKVDQSALKTELSSPRHNGKVLPEHQIVCEDRMGRIHADDVTLWYSDEEKQLKLEHLTITGNVHMINTAPLDPKDTRPVRQYALADKADYYPDTQTLMLVAEEERRVIFYDQINDIQVSAPAVEAHRKNGPGSEAVRGLGDVRFSLMRTELDQLNGILRLYNAGEA